jgi:hypothetical protein
MTSAKGSRCDNLLFVSWVGWWVGGWVGGWWVWCLIRCLANSKWLPVRRDVTKGSHNWRSQFLICIMDSLWDHLLTLERGRDKPGTLRKDDTHTSRSVNSFVSAPSPIKD